MKWSLNLGRIARIKVLIHWTFLILIAWVIISELNRGSDWGTIGLTIGYVLAIFVCVVLHELGHALMARRYGIQTKRIILLPIGGVARLEKIPEEPKRELLVALAGPAVNVVIAVLLYLIIAPLDQYIPATEEEMVTSVTPGNFLFLLFLINVFLVGFNAIPAFPMDGGRVLRALLSMKMDRLRATNIAAKLGQFLAMAFVFLGFLYNPFLIFIGVLVFLGAGSENMITKQMEHVKGHIVEEAMITSFEQLAPDHTIGYAADKLIAGSANTFVVVKNGVVKGILSRHHIIKALANDQKDSLVEQFMQKEYRSFYTNDKLTDVLIKLKKDKQEVFPVMENGQTLKGLLTSENVNEFIMIQSALD